MNIFTEDDRTTNIEFSTEFGNCRASWIGIKPVIGDFYDIEMEIPFVLKWGLDILPYQDQTFQIKINENSISLIGAFHSLEDNLASLKLGDNIILIETEGTPFAEGIFIEAFVNKVVLYNSNT